MAKVQHGQLYNLILRVVKIGGFFHAYFAAVPLQVDLVSDMIILVSKMIINTPLSIK